MLSSPALVRVSDNITSPASSFYGNTVSQCEQSPIYCCWLSATANLRLEGDFGTTNNMAFYRSRIVGVQTAGNPDIVVRWGYPVRRIKPDPAKFLDMRLDPSVGLEQITLLFRRFEISGGRIAPGYRASGRRQSEYERGPDTRRLPEPEPRLQSSRCWWPWLCIRPYP